MPILSRSDRIRSIGSSFELDVEMRALDTRSGSS